jgi:hypothetical protein
MTDEAFDKLARYMSGPEALERKRRFEKNVQYALTHLEEWRLQYPDSWVAAYNEELVGVAKDSDELLSTLRSKRIPIEEVFLRFIPKEKYSLVL